MPGGIPERPVESSGGLSFEALNHIEWQIASAQTHRLMVQVGAYGVTEVAHMVQMTSPDELTEAVDALQGRVSKGLEKFGAVNTGIFIGVGVGRIISGERDMAFYSRITENLHALASATKEPLPVKDLVKRMRPKSRTATRLVPGLQNAKVSKRALSHELPYFRVSAAYTIDMLFDYLVMKKMAEQPQDDMSAKRAIALDHQELLTDFGNMPLSTEHLPADMLFVPDENED